MREKFSSSIDFHYNMLYVSHICKTAAAKQYNRLQSEKFRIRIEWVFGNSGIVCQSLNGTYGFKLLQFYAAAETRCR